MRAPHLPSLLILAATACSPRTIDLGGGDAGPASNPEASAPEADVAAPFTPTTATITTCSGPSGSSAALGDGYNAVRPASCDAPRGADHPVSSAADVTAALVGLWYDCSSHGFGIDFGPIAERGIELTSDGHYRGYTSFSDWTLVPLDQALADAGPDAG